MRLVRAELLKLFSTRLWWIMLVVVLSYLTLSLGLVIGFAGVEQNGVSVFPARDTPEFQRVAWEQAVSGAILVAILGATMMTTEYRYQTITSTFLTTPKRERVVAAKLGAGALVGLGFGLAILALFASVIIPAVLLSGGELLITEGGVPRILGGVLAALMLYTLFGIGIGALLRNQIGAIVAVAVWMFVIEPLLNAIQPLQAVGKWTPAGASRALTNPGVDIGQMGLDYLLPAWAGALVLLGYAVLFSALASVTTLRRDIT